MSHLFVRCACGNRIRLRAEHAGKTGRCTRPGCGRPITVPPAASFQGREGQEVTLDQLQTVAGPATTPPAATPSGLWRPGAVVDGRYEVRGKLGEGTFGSVWHAWHNEWGLDLAVKELRQDRDPTPQRRQNFLRECQAWIDLGLHPHVVTAWYVRELEGTPYLFLEHCDGGSLADWIGRGQTGDLVTALDIGIQLCWGLAHCHHKGIVHRDLKPLNVLMTRDGAAKLTDFGTVKFAAAGTDAEDGDVVSDLRKTIGGRLQGTPPYMPPEQWERGSEIGRSADLYALGVTLFELVTGDFPVRPEASTLAGWARAHATANPVPLGAARPDAPAALQELVRRCLAKRPGERFHDALDVARDLVAAYGEADGRAYPRREPQEAGLLAPSLNNRAVSLYDMRRVDEPERAPRKAPEADSGQPGATCDLVGLRDDPERVWLKALEADPHQPEATYNLGLVRWREGRLTDEEFLRALKEVAGTRRGEWLPSYLLAEAHAERGDCAGAAEILGHLAGAGQVPDEVRKLLAWAEEGRPRARRLARTLEGHTGPITALAWGDDGRHALTGSEDWSIRLWDLTPGKCLGSLEGHGSWVNAVAWGRGGRAALSGSADRTLKLWDVTTGRCLATWVGHLDAVTAVDWSADAHRALSGGADALLKVWDARTGDCLQTLEGHLGDVTAVAWGPGDRRALTGGWDRTARLWRLAWERTSPLALSRLLSARATLSAREAFEKALGAARTSLARGDAVEAARQLRDARAQPGRARDGEALGLWAELYLRLPHKGLRGAWEERTFEMRRLAGGREPVTAACWCGDGRHVLAGGEQGLVRVWDSEKGTFLHVFEGHQGPVTLVREAAGGRYALTGSEDTTLRVWEVSTGKLLRTLKGHAGGVTTAAWGADGLYALSGGADRALRLWDVRRGRCLRVLEGHAATVVVVDWAGDDRPAVSIDWDGVVKAWDVAAGKCRDSTRGPAEWVTAAGWSADRRHALVASEDLLVRLWEAPAGRCLKVLTGHRQAVTAVAYGPDGRHALSGDAGGVVKLWDVRTGECVRSFEGHGGRVAAVAWEGGGRRALTASADGTLRLWFLDWELEDREPADWDEGARPFLESFLVEQTPYAAALPDGRQVTAAQLALALARRGRPTWGEQDFRRLLHTLACAGYGWLRPEGVYWELQPMTVARWRADQAGGAP